MIGVLKIKLESIQNLRSIDLFGKMSPFVEFWLHDARKDSLVCPKGNINPVWNETICLVVKKADTLKIVVKKRTTFKDEYIAHTEINIGPLISGGKIMGPFKLLRKQKDAGMLNITLTYEPELKGEVFVHFIEPVDEKPARPLSSAPNQNFTEQSYQQITESVGKNQQFELEESKPLDVKNQQSNSNQFGTNPLSSNQRPSESIALAERPQSINQQLTAVDKPQSMNSISQIDVKNSQVMNQQQFDALNQPQKVNSHNEKPLGAVLDVKNQQSASNQFGTNPLSNNQRPSESIALTERPQSINSISQIDVKNSQVMNQQLGTNQQWSSIQNQRPPSEYSINANLQQSLNSINQFSNQSVNSLNDNQRPINEYVTDDKNQQQSMNSINQQQFATVYKPLLNNQANNPQSNSFNSQQQFANQQWSSLQNQRPSEYVPDNKNQQQSINHSAFNANNPQVINQQQFFANQWSSVQRPLSESYAPPQSNNQRPLSEYALGANLQTSLNYQQQFFAPSMNQVNYPNQAGFQNYAPPRPVSPKPGYIPQKNEVQFQYPQQNNQNNGMSYMDNPYQQNQYYPPITPQNQFDYRPQKTENPTSNQMYPYPQNTNPPK